MKRLSTTLVTGAAGYFGSTVCRNLLAAGHRVIGVDSCKHGDSGIRDLVTTPDFSFHRLDIRRGEKILDLLQQSRSVVHLAALVGEEACRQAPVEASEVNFNATQRLAETAARAGIERFLFASTCSNYGQMAPHTNAQETLREDSPLRPMSLYAESKVSAESYLLQAGLPLEVLVFRFSTLFGLSRRMRFDLTVNHFTRDLLLGLPLVVFSPDTWRPYLHVEDAAQAVRLALDRSSVKVPSAQVFNVGGDSLNFTKRELALGIAEAVNSSFKIEWKAGGSDARNYRVSFSRIQETFGFTPSTELLTGVAAIASALDRGEFPDPFATVYQNHSA